MILLRLYPYTSLKTSDKIYVIGKIIIAHVIVIQNGRATCLHVITLLTNNVTINITVKISFNELCDFQSSSLNV